MFPASVFWSPSLCIYVAMFSNKGLPCFPHIVLISGCGVVGEGDNIKTKPTISDEASGSWVPMAGRVDCVCL